MKPDNIAQPNVAVKVSPKWKKLLWVIPLTLLLLVALAWLTALLLEDAIKQKIVAEINEQVTVPVHIKGDINFSLLKHFPYASLTFTDVSIEDRLQKQHKNLLRVHEFSFLCNIYSLFGQEIEFSKIVVKNGELNLLKDKSGNTNFDILKAGKTDTKPMAVRLKKVQIQNLQFHIVDQSQQLYATVQMKDAQLSGNFNDNYFLLKAKSKLLVSRAAVKNETFLSGKSVMADIQLDVNKSQKKFNLRKSEISINQTKFNAKGFLSSLKNGAQVNFTLINTGNDIRQLIELIPEKYKSKFANTSGSGEYSIRTNINGMLNKNSSPNIKVEATLTDGEVQLSTYNKILQQVNTTVSYEYDDRGNDRLEISNFNCTLNNLPFNFKLTLNQLNNPTFNFFSNGVLQLSELESFIPDSVVQDLGGTITFNQFHLSGRKEDFTNVETSTLTGSGEFKLNEVEFRQNGISYGNISGILKYENQLIDATDLTLNFLSTDFSFTGTVHHLFAFVYNLSSKRKTNGVELGVNGKVHANTFNLTGILDAYDKKNRPESQRKDKIDIREIFNMKGNLEVDIERFLFREMEFKDLHTAVQIAPGAIRINRLNTWAMAGSLQAGGLIQFTPDNALKMQLDVTAIDLSIPHIFTACENFGQKTLSDKNLKGTVSTAVSLDATWLNYKTLDTKNLSCIIDFNIKNGELIKFEPLRAASKFIRIEELEHIRFADLSNTIKIANERIDVPEFEIKTSALNLIFWGYHHFNNDIDYHLKINLHKLLAQKFKRNTNQAQYIEDDPYEGVNIYLSMTGNLRSPIIKFDKPTIRKKIVNDFKNEKQVLKDLLKNAPKRIDEHEQKREDKYFDLRNEPVFMDFDTTIN